MDRKCNLQTIFAIVRAAPGQWSPALEDAALAGIVTDPDDSHQIAAAQRVTHKMRHRTHGGAYNHAGQKLRPVDTVTMDDWDIEPTREQLVAIEREMA